MKVSALVLAGGRSRRMGSDKTLLRIGDETFLGLITRKLSLLSEDILIAGSHREGYAEAIAPLPVRFVPDSFENCGPLAGLHAGLQAMRHDIGIVVACDMPLINIELIKHMVSLLDMGRGEAFGNAIELAPSRSRMLRPYDVVMPHDKDGWHPLHAVYRRSCLAPIGHMLRAGDLRVQNLIQHLNVRAIEPDDMAIFDPHGFSLKNLNTPAELVALKALLTDN